MKRLLVSVILFSAMTGCATMEENGETLTTDEKPQESAGNTVEMPENIETVKAIFEEGSRRMKDNPRASLDIFSEASRLAPNAWTPHYNKALVYLQFREFRKTESELNIALNKKAPHAIIYSAFGTLYLYMDNRQKAIDAFEKALAAEKTPATLINLASLYHMNGDVNKAAGYLNELEGMAPDNKTLFYNIGLLWYKMGKYHNAEKAFEKVLSDENRDAKVLYLSAQTLLKEGKYEAALKVFQEISAANILDPAPYREMGIIYEVYLGDTVNALENYQSYVTKGGEKSKEVEGWIELLKERLSKEGGQVGSS